MARVPATVCLTMFGTLLFLPLFIQSVVGLSAQNSGLILSPMMLSFMVGSAIGGQIVTRTGRYKVQAVILVGGAFMMFSMAVSTTWPTVVRNMVVLGLGIGTVLPLLNVAVQNAFPYKVMGVVNATQQFTRSLSAVIVTPILGTLMSNVFKSHLEKTMLPPLKAAVAHIPPAQRKAFLDPQGLTNPHAQAAIQQKFKVFGQKAQVLYHEFSHAVRLSINSGFHEIFILTILFAIGALVASLFLREVKLKEDEYYQNRG